MQKLDNFTQTYIECAFWTSVDDDNQPLLKNYSITDLATSTLAEMVADCERFQRENAEDLLESDDSYSGHDFWLSRNNYGSGFFDRGYGELGDRLQEAAEKYGEYNFYVGNDDKIWGFSGSPPE